MIKKRGKNGVVFLILAFLTAYPLTPAIALPQGEEVVSGTASFEVVDGSTLTITASDQSIIQYDSFSVAANETVNFILPSTDAMALNRVVGSSSTQILGNLYANGNLVLVNQNGIYFGPSAQVDVGSLIASTHNITDANFLSGQYIFAGTDNNANAFIFNEGTIRAADGGYVILAADAVRNTGVIEAPLGTVSLAAGTQVTVALYADGLVSVAIDQATAHTILDSEGNPLTTQLENQGTLQGATVKLNARSASEVFQSSINQEGVIRATDVRVGQDGVVEITASGLIQLSGEITAKRISIHSDTDVEMEGVYDNLETGSTTVEAQNEVRLTGDLTVRGDLIIREGTTFKAQDATLTISKDWVNQGVFQADSSLVQFVGPQVSTIYGDNTFNDLTVIEPGKTVNMEAGRTQEIVGVLTLRGSSGNLLNIQSTNSSIPASINILGTYSIDFINLQNMINVLNHGPPVYVSHSNFLSTEGFSILLTGPTLGPIYIYGDNTFVNVEITSPDQEVYFEAGSTTTITGDLHVQGGADLPYNEQHVKFRSTVDGSRYYLNLESANSEIDKLNIKDAYSIAALFIPHGVNGGNNVNITIDPLWDGDSDADGDGVNWSDQYNWQGDALPTGTDPVSFDNTDTGNITVDNVGSWSGGDFTISSGYTGTITLNVSITVGALSVSDGILALGTYNITNANTVTLLGGQITSSSGTVTSNNTYDLQSGTISAILGGTIGLTKSTAGTVTLSGLNTYTGTTTINGGTLSVNMLANGGSASPIGASVNTAAKLVFNTGTLKYTGSGHSTDRRMTFNLGSGTIDASGSGTLTFSDTNALTLAGTNWARTITLTGTGNGSLAALIPDNGTGATALTKSGAGTWTLSNGASTYTGVTQIDAGTLSVSTLANGGANSDIGAANNGATDLVFNGGTLKYTGGGVTTNRLFDVYTTGGTIEASGSGALNFSNGGNMGTTNAGTRTLTLTGTNTGANTLAAVIADNTNATSLTKSGVGSWTLSSGANSYTGATTITAGTLSVGTLANGGANSDIGASTNAAANLVFNGGTLQYTGGTVSTDRAITFAASAAIDVNTGGTTLTISGAHISAGGLNKTGSGTLVLSGSSTNTGATTVTAGTLKISIDANLGTAPGSPTAGQLVFNGGTLQITASFVLNSNRGISLQSGGGTISVDNTVTFSYAGTMTGTGALTLSGLGSMTIPAGGSITTGDLTVNISAFPTVSASLLDINGNLSVGASTSMTVPAVNFKVSGNFSITAGGSITNVTKIEFDGSGTQTFDHTLVGTFDELVHSGSGTLQLTGTGVLTLNSFSNTAGTFDLNGKDLTVSTGAFTNQGNIQLQGMEAVSLVTNATTAGTWTYVGRNIAEGVPIKDFGSADYYNLVINDTNPAQASFAASSSLVINGTLTLSSGTFAHGTNTVTAAAYTQTGGTFTGGSVNVTINGAAAISGTGTLMNLTSGTTQVITMSITSPATVRLASGSTLTITGSGTALSGTGTLDTTTNGNNTVQFTGTGVTIPVGSPFYNLSLIPVGFSVDSNGTLTFNADEIGLASAVVDMSNGFAYFGTGTAPGIIVKVRLADNSRVGALTLNAGEDYLNSAVIDTENSFAYFGTGTSPGIVVKVNLSAFTRTGALSLASGENNLTSAVIDLTGATNYAYFGTYTSAGKVIKIDLGTFLQSGSTLTLNSGEDKLTSAVIDTGNGFAYFGTSTSPGKVVKVQLSDISRVGALTAASGENNFTSAVLGGTYAYFGTYTSPGKIVPVNLATFQMSGTTLTLNTGENLLTSAVVTGGSTAYFGTDTAPGVIVKVTGLGGGSPSRDSILTLGSNEDYLYSAVIDTSTGYAYFGTVSSPSYVVSVKLSNFTRVSALAANVAENFIASAVVDTTNGFAYFGTYGTPGVIVKARLSDSARIGALTLSSGENQLVSAVINSTHAFFGTNTSPGIVVKVQLSDFTRVGALTLNSGENSLTSAVINGANAYFGTATSPGIVAKVQLSDLTRVGIVTLNSGENNLSSAVVDTANSLAYFGTDTAPGIVVKMNVGGTFSRAGAVTLNSGENSLRSAVIDTANNYAYFGTGTGPGIVVRMNVSTGTFSRSSSLTLNSGENFLYSAVIDTTNGYAYFGTYTAPGIIAQVKLSDLTRNAIVTLASGQNYLSAAVIDVSNNTAYFGTDTAPGRMMTIRLGGTIILGTATSQTLTVNNNLLLGDGVKAALVTGATWNPVINVTGNFTMASLANFTSTSGVFSLAGNWSNSGTFTANSGSVTLNGGNQSISGSTTFYSLTKTVSSGDYTLTFQSGSGNQTNVAGTLSLSGNATNRLKLRSTDTSQWYINHTGPGGGTMDYLDVERSNAVAALSAVHSVAGPNGNNTNWNLCAGDAC